VNGSPDAQNKKPAVRRPWPLIPVHQALARLLGFVSPAGAQRVRVGETVGKVLAAPLIAAHAVPPVPVALRDGWAVAATDVIGASSYSPVLMSEAPTWVEVGLAMPTGTDLVLPLDGLSLEGGAAEIVASGAPGEGVRRRGEDIAAGSILRDAGEEVRPYDIALASCAGIEWCEIHEVRVRLLSPPSGGAAASGELARRFFHAAGATVDFLPLLSRDAKAIAETLQEPGAELIVVIGGTGLGRADHAAEALGQAGTLMVHGLAMRPGETSGCGLVGQVPTILVPGRPEAALAAMLLLARPCLDRLMGITKRLPQVAGRLTRKVSSAVGITEIVLLRRSEAGLEPLAVGDITLAAIAAADAWSAVPPDSEGFAAGETVEAFLL
jgi:molybdopterin molybdotransferase